MRISDLKVVQHFVNNGVTHGVYSVKFKDITKVFIRNGDSFGAISYFIGEPVSKCIGILRDDVKEELIECLRDIGLE